MLAIASVDSVLLLYVRGTIARLLRVPDGLLSLGLLLRLLCETQPVLPTGRAPRGLTHLPSPDPFRVSARPECLDPVPRTMMLTVFLPIVPESWCLMAAVTEYCCCSRVLMVSDDCCLEVPAYGFLAIPGFVPSACYS